MGKMFIMYVYHLQLLQTSLTGFSPFLDQSAKLLLYPTLDPTKTIDILINAHDL